MISGRLLAVKRTIEEIEGVREPDPGPDATTLMRRCWTLRRKPLAEFTTEDLRIMLGQQLAVPILLPLAVEVLTADPDAEGHFYPGDLLDALARLPDEQWRHHEDARRAVAELLRR